MIARGATRLALLTAVITPIDERSPPRNIKTLLKCRAGNAIRSRLFDGALAVVFGNILGVTATGVAQGIAIVTPIFIAVL